MVRSIWIYHYYALLWTFLTLQAIEPHCDSSMHIIEVRSNDPQVFKHFEYICNVTFKQDAQDICFNYIHSNSPIIGTTITHYSPIPVDYSCLLSPPLSPDRIITFYQQPNNNNNNTNNDLITLESIIEFINIHTDKYRQPNGMISDIGVHIQTLENSLYSLTNDSTCEYIHINELDLKTFINSFLLRQKPVVIRGFDQVSHKKDSNDVFASLLKHLDDRVGVKLSPSSQFEGIDDLANWGMASSQIIPPQVLSKLQSPHKVVVRAAHEDMSLLSFLSMLTQTEPDPPCQRFHAYVEYLPLDAYLPGFLNSLLSNSTLSLLSVFNKGKPYLWLGDGQAIGKLHFDPFDNILIMLEGAKTFTLIDPNENTRMGEGHMREAQLEVESSKTNKHCQIRKHQLSESTSMVHSPVELHDLKYAHIPRVHCSVGEGEAIFVPSFWWHEVSSIPGTRKHSFHNASTSINAAVNYWFPPVFNKKFPCATCRKRVQAEYRKKIEQWVEEKG